MFIVIIIIIIIIIIIKLLLSLSHIYFRSEKQEKFME